MKKKNIQKGLSLSIVCLLSLNVFAQNEVDMNKMTNIDWKEDTAEIVTVDDILKTQQEITVNNTMESHFRDVWSRKDYINIGYNSSTLTPKEDIPLGMDATSTVPKYSSSWGFSFQTGKSSRLHKRPISNMLQFYFDFSYVDLNVNHYKQDGARGDDGGKLYDTSRPTSDGNFYIPWKLEKYEFNYGMSVGPSVTVAPFTTLGSKNLHYIKFNIFYHLGYHASIINMRSDENADVNTATGDNIEKVRENVKLLWGHGLTSSFGFSVTWKFIGIGYEIRTATAKYKSIDTSTYGSEKYKFKTTTNRIFLQFRI